MQEIFAYSAATFVLGVGIGFFVAMFFVAKDPKVVTLAEDDVVVSKAGLSEILSIVPRDNKLQFIEESTKTKGSLDNEKAKP